MKEEWRIIRDKDYCSGREEYVVCYNDVYERKYESYSEARSYIEYMMNRYYVSVDPYESASERKARLIRENRDNKINQILG